MAKSKKKSKGNKSSRYTNILVLIFVTVALLCIALFVVAIRQADEIGKYQLLEKIDNQACRYLNNQAGVNGSFDLNVNAPKNKPKLVYTCLTGESTKARTIQGKFIGKYGFGASVSYFSTDQEARKFAGEKLNPLRYWGVDEEGQQNGIPQTSRFTFIVTDEKIPYFDAYTVKANAVLRVSLPCKDNSIKGGVSACNEEATSMLNRELKGINVL